MGGVINVAFRFPDGKVKTVSAWTNPLRNRLMVPAVFKGEGLHTLFEDSDEPCPVAPRDYGLMVYDYVSKTIFAMNTYGHHNYVDPILITPAANGGFRDQYEALMAENRLGMALLKTNGAFEDRSPLDPSVTDFETLVQKAKDMFDAGVYRSRMGLPRRMEVFTVDTAPMAYRRFEEYEHDEMLKALDDVGLPLTAPDRQVWKDQAEMAVE